MQRKEFATSAGNIVYFVSDEVRAELPWIAFLPGLTVDHRLFELQIEYFEGRANCFVWDPPAHGLSRPFALTFSMDDMARWLGDLFDAEGVVQPTLVGQSMGGYVAQAFVDVFPGRAGGFISLDSAPLQKRYIPGWELAMLKHTEGMYRAIPWSWLKVWAPAGISQGERGRDLMRLTMDGYEKSEYCALAGFGYRILAEAIEADRAYEVDCPALLVCGTKDYAGDVRAFNRKWTAGSGIPLHWVEGAGHNVNCDAPDEINRVIEEFVASLPRG